MSAQRHDVVARKIDLSELFTEVADAALNIAELFSAYAGGWVMFHDGRKAELIRAHLHPKDGLSFEIAYVVDGVLSPTKHVSIYDVEYLTAEAVSVDWEE